MLPGTQGLKDTQAQPLVLKAQASHFECFYEVVPLSSRRLVVKHSRSLQGDTM